MIEKAYTFGKDGCLVGIVTEPDAGQHMENMPAVLLWNAGLLHRVGPYRLYVDMARNLASSGFLVFRFDLSGKGDSLVGKDNRLYDERLVDDIQEAMNFLSAKNGIAHFVLVGLCSGADDAHSVAVLDSRVSGAVFLDGYGYRTWGYYLHHYGPRLFKLRVWKNFLKRKYFSVFVEKSEDGDETDTMEQMFERDFPPKENVTKEIQGLINRGLNLLYIYSGGVKYSYYNYHGQFEDMFRSIDFQDKVHLEYFDKAGHTYPLLEHRDKLMATISDWMQTHYNGK